jgi:hypothetical protein
MSRFTNVKRFQHLVKDKNSGAIINTNRNEYNASRIRLNVLMDKDKKISNLEEKVEKLESLVEKLLEKV